MLSRTIKFAALLLSLGMMTTTVAVYALDASTGYNLNRLPLENQVSMLSWVPEGWAFFTRDPREEGMFVYSRREDGSWRSVVEAPLSAWGNAFGFDRGPRRQGVEMGLLAATLPIEGWTPCVSTELPRCLEDAAPTLTFANPSPAPTLCGELAVVRRKPVPFAWVVGKRRDDLSGFRVPNNFIRVQATC